MATTMNVESTEYVYVGVTGDIPDTAEIAFLAAGTRPTEDDWQTGTLITSASDPLWTDAKASGVTGTYYVAILVGDYNDNDFSLAAGNWQGWVRLSGDVEQVVLNAPTAFTIAGGSPS